MAGGDIRGSATGTEEWDVLSPLHVTERIHGVVLAGGSAFGLESACGVRRFLEHKGVGFETGVGRVPLVVGAILYDLGVGKAGVRPTREMGESGGGRGDDGTGDRRRGGRGHRSDRRQDAGHGAGDEIGRGLVDGAVRPAAFWCRRWRR